VTTLKSSSWWRAPGAVARAVGGPRPAPGPRDPAPGGYRALVGRGGGRGGRALVGRALICG